jgi:hypothetical protein
MATTFENTTLFEGNNMIIVHLQAYGDTDQSAVQILDLSALTFPDNRQAGHLGVAGADKLSLLEAAWSIQTFGYVQLLWDATADDEIITMSGDGYRDFRPVGGKHDPQSTGTTGDVLITTSGAAAGASYDIELVFRKKAG